MESATLSGRLETNLPAGSVNLGMHWLLLSNPMSTTLNPKSVNHRHIVIVTIMLELPHLHT